MYVYVRIARAASSPAYYESCVALRNRELLESAKQKGFCRVAESSSKLRVGTASHGSTSESAYYICITVHD